MRRVLGKVPFSTYFTQVRFTLSGTWFSVLHATVQAWQPMHLRLSMMNPYRIQKVCRAASNRCAAWVLYLRKEAKGATGRRFWNLAGALSRVGYNAGCVAERCGNPAQLFSSFQGRRDPAYTKYDG